MFNFQKQAAFEVKLAHVYDKLAPEFKAEVSLPDFLLEFLIIEVNGKAIMPDKPGDNDGFMLTDKDFEQVIVVLPKVWTVSGGYLSQRHEPKTYPSSLHCGVQSRGRAGRANRAPSAG